MQNRHHQIKQLSPVFFLAAIYLVWLLMVLIIFGYTPTNDGLGYVDYARQCLNEGAPYPTVSIYKEAPFVWNIGIINLIELSLWLTKSIWPVLLVMCMMKAATGLFMALTAEKLFGNSKVAIVALLFFMLYPNNWGQSTMISSEIPSTCLAVVAVYLVVSRRQSLKMMALAGLLLALANWFRPTALIFIVSIILFILIYDRRQALKRLAYLLGAFALFAGSVGAICYFRTGHFVYQARSYWFSMVDECYDGAPVSPHWGQPIWPKGYPRYIENYEQMDCFEYERIWKERSLNWLKDHKLEYLKKIPGRLYYMYQSDYDNMSAFLKDKSRSENNHITLPYRRLLSQASSFSFAQWLSFVCLLFYIVLLVLAVMGSYRMMRKRQYKQLFLPLFIVVGGSLAIVLVMHGETRFKDPFMPYIFMLSAVTVAYWQTKRRKGRITHHKRS